MKSSNVIIRNALLADVNALVGLLESLFALEEDFDFDACAQRQGVSSLILGKCQSLRCECVKVAEIERQVIGMCTAQLLISTAEGGPAALVEDLVVSPSWRGRGIGSRLLGAIENWAHENGASRLQLLADCSNDPALEFYAKQNWKQTRLVCLRKKA